MWNVCLKSILETIKSMAQLLELNISSKTIFIIRFFFFSVNASGFDELSAIFKSVFCPLNDENKIHKYNTNRICNNLNAHCEVFEKKTSKIKK
jgi:hypothetical protein